MEVTDGEVNFYLTPRDEQSTCGMQMYGRLVEPKDIADAAETTAARYAALMESLEKLREYKRECKRIYETEHFCDGTYRMLL